MTKDYAKRRRAQYSNAKRQKKTVSIIPAWGWMSIGLLLGICCAILYWQLQNANLSAKTIVAIHEEPPKTSPLSSKAHTKSRAKIHREAPQQHARFDFYTVLPNMNQSNQPATKTSPLELALQPLTSTTAQNTPLADEEPTQTAQAEQTQEPPPPAASYVIQAGSFHRHEQAEALKAQLAFLGFEASIQTFRMGNRETRYRVVIGPFSSKDHAYLQQQHLEQAQHLHSVVLKIKV